MRIEIEISKAEEIYLSTCCIKRVTNSALHSLPRHYDHIQDVIDLGDIMEPLRWKMADAIFRAKLKLEA